MVEEAYERSTIAGKAAVDAVKHALIAHEGRPAVERMYPEWFPEGDIVEEEVTDEDIEDSEGQWIFTHENVTEDDMESVLQQLGQGMSVTGVDTERLRALMPDIDLPADEEGWI